jgi:hypothetical protein
MVCAMARHHWFSNERAANDLGYHPPVSLQRGLELTCDYFHRQVITLDIYRLTTLASLSLIHLLSQTQ